MRLEEDLAFYLTESQQTPSAVGLNVLLDTNDKVKVAGGFLLQVLHGAKEEEITRFEKRTQKCLLFQHFWNLKTILKPCFQLSMATIPTNACQGEELRFQCDCSKERF